MSDTPLTPIANLRGSTDDKGWINVNLRAGTITLTGADGAILDGADPSIRATVLAALGSGASPLTVAVLDGSGNQVTAFGGSGGNAAASPTGSAVPADADYLGFQNPSGNLEGLLAETFDCNTGAGTDPKAVLVIGQATGSGGLPISAASPLQVTLANTGANATAVKVDGSAVTQPVSAASLPLPTGASTAANQSTGNTSLADIDTQATATAAVSGVTSGAKVITDANGTIQQYLRGLVYLAITAGGWLVTATLAAGTAVVGAVTGAASAANGWTKATGSIGATKTDIGTANTPAGLAGWYFYNSNSSVAYVQMFNAQASAVTLGSTAPDLSFGIPATSAANVPAGIGAIAFGTALSIAITTTRAGATGPANTVDFNLFFKQ